VLICPVSVNVPAMIFYFVKTNCPFTEIR
jgi:hypothetical protein